MIGIALHKSTDGTSMINYAQWRPQADFDTHLAQFSQNASHIDPHTYEVVSL